jgi:oligopeptide/dipeptide ABC transporter ATP-binding protein
MPEPVLQVRDLATYFYVAGGVVKAVDGLDLEVAREEIVTVVGESGSGKSVTALSIMGLIREPGRVVRGEIRFGGLELTRLDADAMQKLRGNRLGMIFQNPFTALHPFFRIGDQMTETISLREGGDRRAAERKALEVLEQIGVEQPQHTLRNYPFEVSAGVCQRVMLAMALLGEPELLIADEPTTNLDAVAQVQILELIKGLRTTLHMSVLFITHDFGVVAHMADRVVVMYAGRPAEWGSAEEVLNEPKHPYSIGLIDSVPVPGRKVPRLNQIPGEVPDVMRLPPGCSFRPRCPHAMPVCLHDPPAFPGGGRQHARCWLYRGELHA